MKRLLILLVLLLGFAFSQGVTGLRVVNNDTGEAVALEDGMVVTWERWNIVADTSPEVNRVSFHLNGEEVRIETQPVFALCQGNDLGALRDCGYGPGSYELVAVPNVGESAGATFTRIEGAEPTPEPDPEPTPEPEPEPEPTGPPLTVELTNQDLTFWTTSSIDGASYGVEGVATVEIKGLITLDYLKIEGDQGIVNFIHGLLSRGSE